MTSRHDIDLIHLTRSIDLADEAVIEGNHPFGSVLVSAEGDVLAEAKNTTPPMVVRGMPRLIWHDLRPEILISTRCVGQRSIRRLSPAQCVPAQFIGRKLARSFLA
jgi:hypothetical protein